MFRRHKRIQENTPAPTHEPVTFYGINIPQRTLEDNKWEKKFQKFINNQDMGSIRDMLHKAMIDQNLTRLNIGLRLQSMFPQYDFLKEGEPSSLYPDVWNAQPASILDMYINTYYPTTLIDDGEDLNLKTLNDLAYDTKKKWAKKGCGEYAAPLMLSLFESGYQTDALMLVDDPHFDVNYKSGEPLIKMIKDAHWENFQKVLEKDPDLSLRSKEMVEAALKRENTAFLHMLVIKKGIVQHLSAEELYDLIKNTDQKDQLEILKEGRKINIQKNGFKKPYHADRSWTVLSDTFVEFSRPQSPDGSKTKYQFDFDAGYMSYHYQNKNNDAIPYETKPLAEVYAQNPQLIDKAIKALTDIGCPAPDLSSIFNESRQASRTIKAVPAAPKQPGLHK